MPGFIPYVTEGDIEHRHEGRKAQEINKRRYHEEVVPVLIDMFKSDKYAGKEKIKLAAMIAAALGIRERPSTAGKKRSRGKPKGQVVSSNGSVGASRSTNGFKGL